MAVLTVFALSVSLATPEVAALLEGPFPVIVGEIGQLMKDLGLVGASIWTTARYCSR